jgi:hypothetical protein
MLRSSMQNIEWSPLDVLHIRFVASLVRHVAKRCVLVILCRKLAQCRVGRDIDVGSETNHEYALR